MAIAYLYVWWRFFGKDYSSDLVVAYGWISVLCFGLGSWLVARLLMEESLNFWGGYVAVLLAAYLFSLKNDLKYWAFLEDNLFLFLATVLILNLVSGNWVMSGLMAITLILSYLLKDRYRSMVWYRSGKKGFLFFLANFGFFVTCFFVYDLRWLCLLIGLISGAGLFILGESFKLKKKNEK